MRQLWRGRPSRGISRQRGKKNWLSLNRPCRSSKYKRSSSKGKGLLYDSRLRNWTGNRLWWSSSGKKLKPSKKKVNFVKAEKGKYRYTTTTPSEPPSAKTTIDFERDSNNLKDAQTACNHWFVNSAANPTDCASSSTKKSRLLMPSSFNWLPSWTPSSRDKSSRK